MKDLNNFSRSVDSITPGKRSSVSIGSNFSHAPITGHAPMISRAPIAKEYPIKDAPEFNVSKNSKRLLMSFVGMAILAVAVGAYFLLPTAKIVITPKTEPMSIKFNFVLDKNSTVLDKKEKIIPATTIIASVEKKEEFTATGKKEIFSKATGTITIYNECFTTPVSLKANNQVVSSDNKVYYMTESVVVPPMVVEDGNIIAGKIDTPVTSSAEGPQYNIEPTDFTLPAVKAKYRCQKIYARSTLAFSGGATGFVTVVSDADLKKAEDFILEEARKEAVKQLEDKKPPEFIMPLEAISIKKDELVLGAKVDQIANKFTSSIKISAIAFLFNPDYTKQIANDLFVETRQDKKDIAYSGSFEMEYADATILGLDKINMTASARTFAYQSVDANLIKSKLLGKNMKEATDYVANNSPEIDKIKITLWPFWVKSVPSFERNVSAEILYSSAQ